jgi:hypothetical protein
MTLVAVFATAAGLGAQTTTTTKEAGTPGSTAHCYDGPAGTAVIFDGRAIHNARLKPHSRQRRTLQAYYSRWREQRTSEWTEIPPRLYQKRDPSLPPYFYAKWNQRNILEGVGRRVSRAWTRSWHRSAKASRNNRPMS